MKILIHSPSEVGGLAEHTNYQARAFVAAGVDLTVLCPPRYLEKRKACYPVARVYAVPPVRPGKEGRFGKFWRIARMAFCLLRNQWRLAWEIWRRKPDAVLLESYMEYLAPLWIWPHVLFSRVMGVAYVANLHDPVRNFRVGPAWWHRLSVALGYWPLDIVVAHQHLPGRGGVPGRINLVEAPVGIYELPAVQENPQHIRAQWGVTDSDVVFLSFGFIRDNKNLDLLIRAMVGNPSAVLVVMGREQSSTQKPLSFYRELADQLGVADRVRFRGEFVPDSEVGNYFSATDFVVLTYDKYFHSQSGVLNLAAHAGKPVLASAGDSPLKDCVARFRLGEFVDPDNVTAVGAGMRRLCARRTGVAGFPAPDWEGYAAHASWSTNASIIVEAIRNRREAA